MITTEKKARLLSPGLLAYIGDGVYELMARRYLLEEGLRNLNDMHQASVKLVNAKAQARGLRAIESILTDREKSIVRRGRNSKAGSVPANTSIIDYRLATGLEALFGYHYLQGNQERLDFIWKNIIKVIKEE